MYKLISLGILLLYPLTDSFSQSQIPFRQLSVKEGLSQNSAISIAQDSTGYLWIATQDGLNKYDGRKFSKFHFTFDDVTKPDYSNLGKVYSDKQGRLWIIPIDKVPYKFNPDSIAFEPLSGIDDASVLFQDESLNLWIGTYSSGLFCLGKDSETPKQIMPPSEILGVIFNIAQAPSGQILLTTEAKILEIDPKTTKVSTIVPKTMYDEPIRTNFSDILFDEDGRQWVGTFGDGLYFRDKDQPFFQRIDRLPFTDPLPLQLNILDLHLDKKGRLWVATYGNGLYMIDFGQHKITHFEADKHNPRALHYNDVLSIYEDSSGTLWFGTDGAGISYYDEYLEKFNSLTDYQTPENISIEVVRSIAVDHDDAIWIGTSGKGLTQYERASNSWRTFTRDNRNGKSVSSNRIMSLLVDDKNGLWIGTQGGGLNIYEQENRFDHYNDTSRIPLSANTIWNIFKDKKNRIWLGTREKGLIQFDKEKGEIKKYTSKIDSNRGPPSNNIRVITDDDKGNLWIGTEANGIAKFNMAEEKFTAHRKIEGSNSLSHDNIKSLYYDAKGILWIGTNGGGLNAFDIVAQKFYSYTEEDGLANNVIYGILPDEEGNLWLSSNKGISKFSPETAWM
ncbi:ligand-binding sensor domain-containing protein [Maribacter halichondriae]|uniref:ligand-binding sensor domain-containing protein n=1 Tax=Maribacter halichondriae TaxID=2980554 RepID=UPI002359DEA5|nr:two-component regulator propeller domain-containing protein [Maribacter sp. Hal144]